MAIMMMVLMTTMSKKHTNIITFEEKCINWRNYYLVKKGATNSRWQWWSPGLGRCRKSIREAPPEKIVYHIWALLFKQRFPSPFSIPGTLYVVLLFADFKQIPQQQSLSSPSPVLKKVMIIDHTGCFFSHWYPPKKFQVQTS